MPPFLGTAAPTTNEGARSERCGLCPRRAASHMCTQRAHAVCDLCGNQTCYARPDQGRDCLTPRQVWRPDFASHRWAFVPTWERAVWDPHEIGSEDDDGKGYGEVLELNNT